MTVGIYQIRNTQNNHIYIGQSIKLSERWKTHLWYLRNNIHHTPYLQNAYNKYKESCFVFEVLLYCEPFDLIRYEQELVNKLSPRYNMNLECVLSPAGRKVSVETRHKMSKSQKGRKHSEQSKRLMSESKKGIPLSLDHRNKLKKARAGVSLSEEHKLNISKSLRGRTLSENHKRNLSKSRKRSVERKAMFNE